MSVSGTVVQPRTEAIRLRSSDERELLSRVSNRDLQAFEQLYRIYQPRLARFLVGSPLRDVERDLVLETLANTEGNRTEAARLLGVSIRTLRNKISAYAADGIDVPRHGAEPASGPVKTAVAA